MSIFAVLRFLYNLNMCTLVVMIGLCALKADQLVMVDVAWDQLISPLYFFMTELLLIGIVSFVVLINTFISMCCGGSKSRNTGQNNIF